MPDADDTQPGYDVYADLYAETFQTAFTSPLEEAAVDAFAAHVVATGRRRVVDVGCGIGHVAAHLDRLGMTVTGVEPSAGMLANARRAHPGLEFVDGDAHLPGVDLAVVGGLLARFSLIHVEPAEVGEILADWGRRLHPGSVVLLAGQSSDEPGVHEFDHLVARAWRWHPDAIGDALRSAGFDERWRTVSRPESGHRRFPEFHICAALS